MKKSKLIILEEDHGSGDVLKFLLHEKLPDFEILSPESFEAGLEMIVRSKPAWVWMDIDLYLKNKSNFLGHCPSPDFQIVFTTFYDKVSINSLRLSGLEYVVRPFDPDEVESMLRDFPKGNAQSTLDSRLKALAKNLTGLPHESRTLMVPGKEGREAIPLRDIIRVGVVKEATYLFLSNGRLLETVRPLSWFEPLLETFGFSRVNTKNMINMTHVSKIQRSWGGAIFTSDGKEIRVPRRKRLELLERMGT